MVTFHLRVHHLSNIQFEYFLYFTVNHAPTIWDITTPNNNVQFFTTWLVVNVVFRLCKFLFKWSLPTFIIYCQSIIINRYGNFLHVCYWFACNRGKRLIMLLNKRALWAYSWDEHGIFLWNAWWFFTINKTLYLKTILLVILSIWMHQTHDFYVKRLGLNNDVVLTLIFFSLIGKLVVPYSMEGEDPSHFPIDIWRNGRIFPNSYVLGCGLMNCKLSWIFH